MSTISPQHRATAARIGIGLALAGIVGALAFLAITSALGERPAFGSALLLAAGVGGLLLIACLLLVELLRANSDARSSSSELPMISFTPPPLQRARPRLTRVK